VFLSLHGAVHLHSTGHAEGHGGEVVVLPVNDHRAVGPAVGVHGNVVVSTLHVRQADVYIVLCLHDLDQRQQLLNSLKLETIVAQPAVDIAHVVAESVLAPICAERHRQRVHHARGSTPVN
jgi:hypothetical protein